MKKIGFCIDSLEMGGAENLLVDIIMELSKYYELSLLTKYKSNSYLYNKVKNKVDYYYLEDRTTQRTLWSRLFSSIKKKMKFKQFEKKIDIVIDFLDGDFHKYIKKIKNKKKIIWLHSNYIDLKKRKRIQKKINYYDEIIVICNDMKLQLLNEEIDKSRMHQIYNFVDYGKINQLLKTMEKYREIYGEYFLTVCRLNEEQKDVITLLIAFKKYGGNEKLIIIGDGPDRKKLEEMSKKLEIDKKVIFLGEINNPYCYMHYAKLFILSSKTEGFGLVLVEALYCGTKVISSNCLVGPREILLDGEIGELFQVGDSDDLLRKIKISLKKEYNVERIKKSLKRFEKKEFIKNIKELLENGSNY